MAMIRVVTLNGFRNHLLAPRADQRQQQAGDQQHCQYASLARGRPQPQGRGRDRGHADQQPDLQAIGDQVAPDQS